MLQKFSIQGFNIGDARTFVIAEAGVNHNGDIDLAKELITEAKKAKVDAIKFQTFIAEELVRNYAPKADYQIKTTSKNESQLDMIKSLELSYDDFRELKEYSQSKNLLFLSTPFDLQSVNYLIKLNVPAFKIGSGDMDNIILLERIALEQKPILLSTGMATIEEIAEIVHFLKQKQQRELLLFHCVTSYPAPFELLNLRFISTLKQTFKIPIGFSDHSLGIKIPPLAVAAGANAIEKHFTLDRTFSGPDHKASIEPEELKKMVKEIRFVESALGSTEKTLGEMEINIKKVARKSIIANHDIAKGAILLHQDLGVKRPGNGISPKFINTLIGKKIKTKLKKDTLITWDMFED